MGKVGRIFCIAIPFALTLISLVFLVLTGLAQTNKDSVYLSNLYFLRANLTGLPADLRRDIPRNNDTDPAAVDGDGHIKILNYYTVGLWNYCAGNGAAADLEVDTGDLDLTPGQDSTTRVDYCTGRDTTFAFDPRAAWGLAGNDTSDASNRLVNLLDDRAQSALDRYRSFFSRAIGPLYILTVASAAITALVSLGAIFSRIGSCATSIACSLTTLLSFLFAAIATAAYAILAGAFNATLREHGVDVDLGPAMLAYIWLAFATSFVAGLFWSLSSCCCSGKSSSSHSGKRGFGRGSGKGGYQNLHGGEQGFPMQTGGWSGQGAQPYAVGHRGPAGPAGPAGGAYEPYRHQAH